MHLMIDLETLSTAGDAAIAQIGLSPFWIDGDGPLGPGLHINVDPQSCIDHGLRVDWSTTHWWMMQEQAARDALPLPGEGTPLGQALDQVDAFITVPKEGPLWSEGQRGNDLLNTIDGVLTKNAQVITVLTTNHVERLDRAMLRPGRLDAVITVKAPEAEAVQRLVRLYGRGLVDANEDLGAVREALAGNIPATIREVVERSKLAMIGNGRDTVTAGELLVATKGMERHLGLLNEVKAEPSAEHVLGAAFGRIIEERMVDGSGLQDAMSRCVDDVREAAMVNRLAARKSSEAAEKGSSNVAKALKPIATQVDEIHSATTE